jgi:hypothetical protein
VWAHLFGEEGLEVGVRGVVGQIDRQMLLKYRNLEAAIEHSLEQYGTETIVSLPECRKIRRMRRKCLGVKSLLIESDRRRKMEDLAFVRGEAEGAGIEIG